MRSVSIPLFPMLSDKYSVACRECCMAGLFDGIADERPRYPVCQIVKIAELLDDEDRAALEQAMADPQIKGSTISRRLRDAGFHIGEHSVNRHRRRGCSCG